MEGTIILFLALLQGITEFIPISSSAHLVLVPSLFGETHEGIFVDVILHLATILAVTIYFFKDVKKCFYNIHLMKLVVISTIPIYAFGFLLVYLNVLDFVRTVEVIAIANIVFALLLLWADKTHNKETCTMEHHELSLKQAMSIGVFQALSVIPGVSRTGACLTIALFTGLTRKEALRFTFLLSIPAIFGAFVFELYRLITMENYIAPELSLTIVSFFIAFITAITVIHFFYKWITKLPLTIFVAYRVVLGIIILTIPVFV